MKVVIYSGVPSDIEALFKSMDYKKDVTMHVDMFDEDIVQVNLDFVVPHRETGSPTTVAMVDRIRLSTSGYKSDPGWVECVCIQVREMLHRFEVHEADEWFRVDGNLFRDPHKIRFGYEL